MPPRPPNVNALLSQAQSPQDHHPQQHLQPADISSFAYEPPPPPPAEEEAIPSHSLGHAGTSLGATAELQRRPQRGYLTGGAAGPAPFSGAAPYTTTPVGVPLPGNAPPMAVRSWDDVARQQRGGKGRHAFGGVGLPAASSEPPENDWVLGGMRQRRGPSGGSRFEARGAGARDAGARRWPSFSAPFDGYGASASGRGGGGGEGGRRDGGTSSSFFDGGESGSWERQVRQSFFMHVVAG